MRRMLIAGEWVEAASGEAIDVLDPATAAVIDSVPAGTAGDAHRAVAAAREAFDTWRRVPGLERCALLHEAARRLRERFDDVARLLTLEEGKPLPENLEEVEWTVGTLDYYAEMARSHRGRVVPSPEGSQLSLVLKEPYGVVGCIAPFNYPLLLMIWKVAPALAAATPWSSSRRR